MQLQYSFICEAATVSADGKLNVLGIFNRIGFPEFPGKIHRLVLVISCLGGTHDFGMHELDVRLMGPDGMNTVDPLNMHIDIEPEGGSANVIGEYNGVEFKEPGPYSFEIQLDGRHFASLALDVLQFEHEGEE